MINFFKENTLKMKRILGQNKSTPYFEDDIYYIHSTFFQKNTHISSFNKVRYENYSFFEIQKFKYHFRIYFFQNP